MDFTMKTPCPNCPFRTDINGYLTGARIEGIIDELFSGKSFTCHKTTVPSDNEDGEQVDGPNAQHCAGALIFLEHQDAPNQMMRIAERLGMYDRNKLDMAAPVPEFEYELIEHHSH